MNISKNNWSIYWNESDIKSFRIPFSGKVYVFIRSYYLPFSVQIYTWDFFHLCCIHSFKSACAYIGMTFILVRSKESHSTFITLINFHVDMALFMILPVAFCNELFTAILTIVVLFTSMDFHMLVKATLILKLLATDFEWTLICRIVTQLIIVIHFFVMTNNLIITFWLK